MAEKKYASWAAKDTREASSLPSDFDAKIVAFQFSKEAPDNYPAQGNPIFGWFTLLVDDAGDWAGKTEEERTLRQAYNLGGKAGDEFAISEDGYGLIPNDDTVNSLRKGSKFDMVKCSLENVGISEAVTQGGDGAKLIGIYAHWRRVEDEKLLGKKREFNNDENRKKKSFPDMTLVPVKLLGDAAKGTTSTASKPAATSSSSSAPAAEPTDLDGQVTSFLMDVLANAKDNKVQRSQLIGLLSKQAIKEKNRQDIARRGSEEEFLTKLAADGVVSFDAAAKPQTVGLAA